MISKRGLMVTFNLELEEKNYKSVRTLFRENGVFYSDSKLANIVKSYIPEDVTEVYDPTAGGVRYWRFS